ncbi:hypothetical protein BX616_003800 [Lobosporangium transversale]|nr:hypothetical protein BX616_003800 [Lobosporangium transversale]
MTEQQGFRHESSGKLTYVNTRVDSRTGEHVILWDDVQTSFADVQYVEKDGAIVNFMVDDGLEELIPLRIQYQPGVILNVRTASP